MEQSVDAVLMTIAERLEDSPTGRDRFYTYMNARPYPRFEAVPDEPGVIVKIDADGTRSKGRLEGRAFAVHDYSLPVPRHSLQS